jgi:NAD(P)-dependent dehydrogenase (short-subunit alcohol dehydrogenase family)
MSEDGYVSVMEINVLGPALLTDELLPLLRGSAGKSQGRVVNVAAAVYGTEIPQTVEELTRISQQVDPVLNSTGEYFGTSKYLLIHHGIELAKREPTITAFSLNPGYSVEIPGIPQQLLKDI